MSLRVAIHLEACETSHTTSMELGVAVAHIDREMSIVMNWEFCVMLTMKDIPHLPFQDLLGCYHDMVRNCLY